MKASLAPRRWAPADWRSRLAQSRPIASPRAKCALPDFFAGAVTRAVAGAAMAGRFGEIGAAVPVLVARETRRGRAPKTPGTTGFQPTLQLALVERTAGWFGDVLQHSRRREAIR